MRTISALLILNLLFYTITPRSWAQEGQEQAIQPHQIFLPTIRHDLSTNNEPTQTDDEKDAGLLNIQLTTEQFTATIPTQSEVNPARSIPATVAALQVASPLNQPASTQIQMVIAQQHKGKRQRVVVRLTEPSLGDYLRTQVAASSVAAQQLHLRHLADEQVRLFQVAKQLDNNTRLLGQVQKALNAIFLEIDSSSLPTLAAHPGVLAIQPIINYTLALTYTVPYIGAREVQAAGYDGTGIRVAILDSGVDYTHANLGGAGNPEDYTNNNPTLLEAGTFPTTKVVGGIDFVGSTWPDTPEMPDPDPLDDGPSAGHGTHVADIIGGRYGVAPGVALYAVKVCSSRSSACSGLALLQAMDYIVDPNADGDLRDAMHVANLSLSADYGSAFDDALSAAVETVTALGVVVVAAAGNGGDKPYVLSTPAATAAAFAVAQTHVPVAIQPFNAVTTTVLAPANGQHNLSTAAGSENLFTKYIVGSSARGPTLGANLAKPDIGAPGASVSAVAGSGTGVSAFGGTSGAAPMISGAVALLRQAYPARAGYEIKALLMNTAATDIRNQSPLISDELAAITRIGGGEIRVNQALRAKAAAWDSEKQTASLSFGFYDVTVRQIEYQRLVTVHNYSDQALFYQIYPQYRFANDEMNSGVEIDTPDELFVPAQGEAQFTVTLEIEGNELRPWSLNAGEQGNNGALLTLLEYDGYVQLVDKKDANNNIHLAWHVLPRQAGDITLTPSKDYTQILNRGVATTTVESYALIGVSDNLPNGPAGANRPTPDFRYLGYTTFTIPVGVCNQVRDSFILVFAANTWERQTHANVPASYTIELDTNQDGAADYLALTRDANFSNNTDGRNFTWVINLATMNASAFFFTGHDTNSANTVMPICAEQIGLTRANALTPINITAAINDTYFGGPGDVLRGITIAPFGERYLGLFTKGGASSTWLEAGKKDKLRIVDYGSRHNNTESGILLLFRGGTPENREAATIVIQPQ